MVPSAYNNNVQMVQTPQHVLILNEMVHSARVVDLSGARIRPASMRFLTGDSIGKLGGRHARRRHDELLEGGHFRCATRDMHLVERFTRDDGNTLRYEFTVDDPDDVDAEVERLDSDEPDRRPDVRVRVPRSQLRARGRAEGRALPGRAGGQNAEVGRGWGGEGRTRAEGKAG